MLPPNTELTTTWKMRNQAKKKNNKGMTMFELSQEFDPAEPLLSEDLRTACVEVLIRLAQKGGSLFTQLCFEEEAIDYCLNSDANRDNVDFTELTQFYANLTIETQELLIKQSKELVKRDPDQSDLIEKHPGLRDVRNTFHAKEQALLACLTGFECES